MNNIWFLRTDKDNGSKNSDFSEENTFIYSDHGTCAEDEVIRKNKHKIFPILDISNHELRKLVRSIKLELVASGKIDLSEPGKSRCDVAICYWIAVMDIGDIVFVRNKQNDVFICKITGYISEAFFDRTGAFQRSVEILQQVSSHSLHERIWNRTKSRKTIERNANTEIKELVLQYLNALA
jgi:hypothetical protein